MLRTSDLVTVIPANHREAPSAYPEIKGWQPTMIPRSPLAPPPLAAAFLQIWSSAALVNRSSIPEYPNSAVYCESREPLTSVSTRRRSDGESGVSVVMDGIREMNSGMKLFISVSVRSQVDIRCWLTQTLLDLQRICGHLKTTSWNGSEYVPPGCTCSRRVVGALTFGVKNGMSDAADLGGGVVARLAVKPID